MAGPVLAIHVFAFFAHDDGEAVRQLDQDMP